MAEGSNGDLWRGIRSQLTALLEGLDPKDLATMSLGLSHSLARYVHLTILNVPIFLKTLNLKVQTQVLT